MIATFGIDGHISREPDPSDRRKLLVVAQEPKDPAVIGAFQALAADMRQVMAHYSHAELKTIHDYVNRTIEVLERQTRLLTSPPRR